MTLREWLAWAAAQLLAGPHPEKARLDAEALLLHHLGKNRAWLLAHRDENFAGCGSIGYGEMIKRRAVGEPIQYITGVCEFYGLPFHVTPDVLIPRPETELLVEQAIALVQQQPSARVADIGSGSGAIAIALARSLPHAVVTSIDLSPAALTIARDNAARLGVANRIRFLHGDLLAPVPGETFDLIVSNPPYVSEADKATLSVEVRDYEPLLALSAGADGLAIYHRLIPAAFAQLAEGGFLLLEIGHNQQEAISALLGAAGFGGIEFTADLQGIPRVATAQHP